MSPEDKAKEMVKMFVDDPFTSQITTKGAKRCAEILCDEILSAIDWHEFETPNKEIEFWQSVKQEIQKLKE